MLELPEPYRKKIENRRLGFSHRSFRGRSWVHVTRPKSKGAFEEACAIARLHGVPRELLPSYLGFQQPGIVGHWNIVDLLPPPYLCHLPDRWRMVQQVGFVVEEAEPVPIVKCGGRLGFWRVPPEVLVQLPELPELGDSKGVRDAQS
jgi:hypothetical protein